MGAMRVVFWSLGAVLVLGALASLFLQAGLSRWVPLGMAGAGLVLIFGLLVMGAADVAQPAPRVVQRPPPARPAPATTVVAPTPQPSQPMPAQQPPAAPMAPGFVTVPDPPARALGAGLPTMPAPIPGETSYTSVARSSRTAADGSIVEGTVRTRRVVRRRPASRTSVRRESRETTVRRIRPSSKGRGRTRNNTVRR